MFYQIIQTATSANSKISYSLFKRVVRIETLTANTYGIIVSDFSESLSINDIITDKDEAAKLFRLLCENSIKPSEFLDYTMRFVDSITYKPA